MFQVKEKSLDVLSVGVDRGSLRTATRKQARRER